MADLNDGMAACAYIARLGACLVSCVYPGLGHCYCLIVSCRNLSLFREHVFPGSLGLCPRACF